MKTTTDPDNWRFSYTITDLALFLGKSPVTLRGWERQGIIDLPRDSGGDRKLTTEDIRKVATIAWDRNRISKTRYQLVQSAMYLQEQVERENSRGK